MLKKILSSTKFYIYSAYLPTVISLFTLPIVTPYLTLRDYGIYGILFSTYNLVAIVSNLGFVVEYQNSFFNSPDLYKDKWANILGFQIIWNLITMFPLLAIVLWFTYKDLTNLELIVVLISMSLSYIILDPLKTIGRRHMQYTDKHKKLFYISSLATLVQSALTIALIMKYKVGFSAWFIGSTLNSIIMAVFFIIHLKKLNTSIIFNFKLDQLFGRIKTQYTIVLHNLSSYILDTSDKLLLVFFKVPMDQIGLYNLAYNYTNYGQTVNDSLNTVFSPLYLKSITDTKNGSNNSEITSLFKFWVCLVFIIIINMIIWSDYIFMFLYRNDSLNDAYLYSFPMIIALLYRPFYVMVVDNLIIQEKTKAVAFISISSALLNFVLNVIFIPFYGIKATVYSTAISYIYMGFAGLLVPFIKKQLTHIYIERYFIILFFIVASILAISFIDFKPLIVKFLFFISSLVAVYLINRIQVNNYFTRIKK